MAELEYRTMRAGEREAFLELTEAAFGFRDVFERYLDEDPDLGEADTLLALEGNRPVSCVQIFTRRIRLRGETVHLGGIGSVATHPDWERRGIASQVLRRAIAEMERRGMALSLLFTGRITFYERLEWVQVPYAGWAIHRGEPVESDARPFRAADLPAVQGLYESFNADLEATTVRDAAYWDAQLRYAGSPDEDFRLVERDGALVAYARAVRYLGVPRVTEYAFAPGAAAELARLLAALAPQKRALLADRFPEAALEAELGRLAGRLDRLDLPDRMWRVLDRARLLALADLPRATSDPDLLRALLDGERALYWLSDRF